MVSRILGDYDALLFDMDGTILTSEAAVERAWRAWAKRVGVPVHMVLAYMHGRRAVDTILHFSPPDRHIEGEMEWLDQIELADVDGVAPMPGIMKVLSSLKPSQWAVVTSANRAVAKRRIAAAGLPLPLSLVASDEVKKGKPHPEGYLSAAAMLGVKPDRCLVFEDAPAGLRAGDAAGASLVCIGTAQLPRGLVVKATIRDFSALVFECSGPKIVVSLS
jgi:mannitol-1-/sugar-/sorbitol-6-phosphatase